MNLKRISLFILMLVLVTPVISQIQTGYVRTVGRPNKKEGQRLSGAAIRVVGLHSPIVSGKNGNFEINLQGGKSLYKLSSVSLNDYELNEKELIGRECGVTTVPHEIVMVSLKEKHEIENRVRYRIEEDYKKKYNELLAQLEAKTILEETYRKQLSDLEQKYEQRELLINDMVERYSHTDYAKLSKRDAEINMYIESGELEKADSIINANGSYSKRKAEYITFKNSNDEDEAAMARRRTAEVSAREELMNDCNAKYSIHLQKYENDSALYYLKELVSYDSLNITNLIKVGRFIYERGSNYNEALQYCSNALTISESLYGIDNEITALCLHNVGNVYVYQEKLDSALLYYNKSLDIRLRLFDVNQKDVATSYINIGNILRRQNSLSNALEYYKKALSVLRNVDENDPIWILAESNLASAYQENNQLDKSISLYNQTIEKIISVYGENSINLVSNYANYGTIYQKYGYKAKALEYYNKALDLARKHYGEKNRHYAEICALIGDVVSDIDQRLLYWNKVLEIYYSIFGEDSPYTGNIYLSINDVYYQNDSIEKSIEYANRSLNVFEHNNYNYGIANAYIALGNNYRKSGNYDMALSCATKAQDIKKDSAEDYGNIYELIAYIYYCKGDKTKAIENFDNFVNYGKSIECYEKAGLRCKGLEMYDDAIRYLKEGLEIRKKNNNDRIGMSLAYQRIGDTYLHLNNYSNAIDYLLKAIDLSKDELDHNYLIDNYAYISKAYQLSGDYKNAIDYGLKCIEGRCQLGDSLKIETADNLWDLGLCYLKANQRELGIEYLKRALDVETQIMDSHDIATGHYNYHLGFFYHFIEDYDNALLNFETALEYGKDNPKVHYSSVLDCYNNIIIEYNRRGDMEKVLDCHKNMLQLILSECPENLISIISGYWAIGDDYVALNDYDQACEYYQKSINYNEKIKENTAFELQNIAARYFSLGQLYANNQKDTFAIESFKKAIINYDKIENKEDEVLGYMASVYQLMADVYMKNNESDSVDFYIDKALTIERELAIKKPETNYPIIERNLEILVNFHMNEGNAEKIYPLLIDLIPVYDTLRTSSPDEYDLKIAQSYANLHYCLVSLDKHQQANDYGKRAIQLFERIGLDSENMINLKGSMSYTLLFSKEYDLSERMATDALALDSTQTWIKTNLLTSLLFRGKYAEAENLAIEIKNIKWNDKELKYNILEDWDKFEQLKLIPKKYLKDVNKLRSIIKN